MGRRQDRERRRLEELEMARQCVDEYERYDSTREADEGSLRKSRRYMALGMVALLLAGGSVGLAAAARGWGEAGERRECWAYEQRVEQFLRAHSDGGGMASLPTYPEDVPGFDSVEATRPAGEDSYTWNPVTGELTCSNHGHYPEGWNAPRSESRGTQVRTVAEGDGKAR